LQSLVGGSRAARAREKDRPLLLKSAIDRIISLERLMSYALCHCVVPLDLAWYLILVRTHDTAIRADEPPLMCVFLLDLIRGEESALPIDSQ
jgi:hypothetical protein